MSAQNDAVRRQLGVGMSTGQRNIAEERFTITRTSNEPEPKKRLVFQMVMGIWMVNDGDGWRSPTAEELGQLDGMTDDLSCAQALYDEVVGGYFEPQPSTVQKADAYVVFLHEDARDVALGVHKDWMTESALQFHDKSFDLYEPVEPPVAPADSEGGETD